MNNDSSPPVHEWTGPTGVKFRDVREPSGTYYHDTTPRKVIDALEHAMRTRARVRLFYGDAKTGRDWLQEWNVTGRVGRSMGPIKIPLLLSSSRSIGGGAILTDSIVRMFVGRVEVYRHPKYKVPTVNITGNNPWHAWVNGQVHASASFNTYEKARRWAAFMRGERLAK
jgi:hypothetical protein